MVLNLEAAPEPRARGPRSERDVANDVVFGAARLGDFHGTSEGSFLRFEDILPSKNGVSVVNGKGNSESLRCNFQNIVNLMLICIEK